MRGLLALFPCQVGGDECAFAVGVRNGRLAFLAGEGRKPCEFGAPPLRDRPAQFGLAVVAAAWAVMLIIQYFFGISVLDGNIEPPKAY